MKISNLRKIKKTTRLITLAVMTILMVFGTCSCAEERKSIDVSEFITVKYGPYNGYAHPEMDIDTGKIDELVDFEKVTEFVMENDDTIKEDLTTAKELGRKVSKKELVEFYKTYFSELIQVQFEEDYQNLSNGDKVMVNIDASNYVKDMNKTLADVEKALGISIKKTSIKYTVEGLKDATKVDAFKGMEQNVTYKGANGHGKATLTLSNDYAEDDNGFYFKTEMREENSVSVVYDNKNLGKIYYSLTTSSGEEAVNLSKDDTIIIVAAPSDELEQYFNENNIVLDKTQLEIKVPDLGDYIETEELTDAQKNEFKEKAIALATKEKSTSEFLGLYSAAIKPDASWNLDTKSTLCLVTRYDAVMFYDYVIYYAEGFTKTPSGEITYTINSKTVFFVDNAEEALNKFNDGCTYQKLN